jgi:hypothetical protein
MTKPDILKIAELHFEVRKKNGGFIDEPDYYRFPLSLPNLKVMVIVNKGAIKEIEIFYEDGGIQTVRPE